MTRLANRGPALPAHPPGVANEKINSTIISQKPGHDGVGATGDLDLPLDIVETGTGRGDSHRQGIDITGDNLIRPKP